MLQASPICFFDPWMVKINKPDRQTEKIYSNNVHLHTIIIKQQKQTSKIEAKEKKKTISKITWLFLNTQKRK